MPSRGWAATVVGIGMLVACGPLPGETDDHVPLTAAEVADEAVLVPALRVSPPTVRSFTVGFTGDTLVHSPLWAQAAANAGGAGFDFRPMLDPLRPLLATVDLAVCHLETPFAPPGEAYSTAPAYGVPREVAPALASAGYDRCSTGSNHSHDRGAAGIDTTVGELEAVGIDQSGMARHPAEIEPRVFIVQGIRVAHLSYSFGFGVGAPAGQPWRTAGLDPERMIADAIEARRRGAEVVVVSAHWGDEGITSPTAAQRRIATALAESGQIDLVVGHHAHVLQPIEQINGVWVAFGLGNLISNMPTGTKWPPSTQDGAMVSTRISVVDGEVVVDRPTVHPTWVDRDAGWLVWPVRGTLADPTTPPGRRAALEESLARTRATLGEFLAPG